MTSACNKSNDIVDPKHTVVGLSLKINCVAFVRKYMDVPITRLISDLQYPTVFKTVPANMCTS